ncbi:hypothetical protein D3C83_222780 [compost metagenome]
MNRFGSKLGWLYNASTPPVLGSRAIAPPCSESPKIEDANFCRSMSMFVFIGGAP